LDLRLPVRIQPLAPEVRPRDLAVDVVPGEDLVLVAGAVGEPFEVDTVLGLHDLDRAVPVLEPEVIAPGVEALPEAERLEDGGADAPVAEREHALERRLLGVVRLHLEPAVAAPELLELLAQE